MIEQLGYWIIPLAALLGGGAGLAYAWLRGTPANTVPSGAPSKAGSEPVTVRELQRGSQPTESAMSPRAMTPETAPDLAPMASKASAASAAPTPISPYSIVPERPTEQQEASKADPIEAPAPKPDPKPEPKPTPAPKPEPKPAPEPIQEPTPEPVKPVQHPPDPAPKRLQKSDFGDRCIDEAVTLHREGRSASAHEALHQALSIATVALKDGDVMTGAALLHRMTEVGPKLRANAITAEAHRQLGAMREDSELPEAHDHFTTALELFEAAADKTGIAQVADHLALMHARLEDAAGAEAYYRYALAQRERSGDRETTVKTLNHLAAVVDHQDRRREAQELVERALTLAKGLKNKTLLEDTESLRKELR